MVKTISKFLLYFLVLLSSGLLLGQNNLFRPASRQQITVDISKRAATISPSMYGVFFEEINHAGDGGLYAELVQNRSFADGVIPRGFSAHGNHLRPPYIKDHLTGEVNQIENKLRWPSSPIPGWSLKKSGASLATMKVTDSLPYFRAAPEQLELRIRKNMGDVILVNDGFWGMNIRQGADYLLRTIVKVSPAYTGTIQVNLVGKTGKVLASGSIPTAPAGRWHDLEQVLHPATGDREAKLEIHFKGTGRVWLDYVSLFPKATFHNRPNGLRADIAGMIADLKPAFMRWPGGSIVGGITLDTRFDWKKTLGDPASRPGQYFTWGYRCSYGFGYYEMLQYCEDIRADAMFVCNAGLSDQFRTGEACSESEVSFYIKDCLDAIEYALGDTTTIWGARRAAHGHPAPFRLKYVEIGNENWGRVYDERFSLFYDAIKKKYPQIQVIYDDMEFHPDSLSHVKTDIADVHTYETPGGFYRSNGRFDKHPRGGYKIYVGEYACNSGVGTGNMNGALSEAAFISGMERNGDLVTMTSYAPLLQNVKNRSWPVNMILFNTSGVFGRSSYYVQRMTAWNRPDYNVWNSMPAMPTEVTEIPAGFVGFGAKASHVEFKNVEFKDGTGKIQKGILPACYKAGKWDCINGILSQESPDKKACYLFRGIRSNDFSLSFTARRFGGKEGLRLYFGADSLGEHGYIADISGGTIFSTAIFKIENGVTVSDRIPQTLNSNKWYKIRLVVRPREVKLYVDDTLSLTFVPKTQPAEFVASGIDKESGELILKVTNSAGRPFPAFIHLKGISAVEKKGEIISLSALHGSDENSLADPDKVIPSKTIFDKFGMQFNYTFPPYSYSIMRIKVKDLQSDK